MYVIGTGTRWTPRRIARGVKRRIVPSPVSNRSDPPVEPPGPFDRRAVLLEGVRREMRILEIGASYSPLAPRKDGWNVRIVDHASREELVEKYSDPVHGVDVSRIEEVDVVWRGGPLDEAIGREHLGFDVCVASHVVEHTPDLVGFLSGVMRLARPGRVAQPGSPDMRYCFDLLRTPTRAGESSRPTAAARPSWLAALVRPGGVRRRCGGDDCVGAGRTSALAGAQRARSAQCASLSPVARRHAPTAEYVDCPRWRFTPASFELLVSRARAHSGILDAHVASIHESVSAASSIVTPEPGARPCRDHERIELAVRRCLSSARFGEARRGASWATVRT